MKPVKPLKETEALSLLRQTLALAGAEAKALVPADTKELLANTKQRTKHQKLPVAKAFFVDLDLALAGKPELAIRELHFTAHRIHDDSGASRPLKDAGIAFGTQADAAAYLANAIPVAIVRNAIGQLAAFSEWHAGATVAEEKPKRAVRRKKTAAPAEMTPATEKPKRTRRKKVDAEAPTPSAEKPKRTRRKKVEAAGNPADDDAI